MKKTHSKFTALLLTALMIVSSWSMQLTAFAAAAPPSQIESCMIYNGLSSGGFDIKFPLNYSSWAESISAVSVENVDYSKIKYSWDYSPTGQQYLVRASDAELIISEGFDSETAECVIKADGYDDLTLTLDKASHTAVIKDSTGGSHESGSDGSGSGSNPGGSGSGSEGGSESGGQTPGGSDSGSGSDGDSGSGGNQGSQPEAPTFTVGKPDFGESGYLILVPDAADYISTITAVEVNQTPWTEQSFKLALNSTQYYKDTQGNRLLFVSPSASNASLKSGDIITIKSSAYPEVRLKLTYTGSAGASITPADETQTPGDEYQLHIRLIGSFESALVNQTGYDAISGASTNITQNKNSSASVEAALLPEGQTPQESDWKPLTDTQISVDSSKSSVNLDPASGMAGVYSKYDSSVTLTGTPVKAGVYPISVTVTDDQGHTATSNTLDFHIYTGDELLCDVLTYDNCTQTADGKYMYDMEPWAIRNFAPLIEKVSVPKDIKAWYGSHTSGTYGRLGYAIPADQAPTQKLIIPSGCTLTFVNMDILSSVEIIVEDGAKLILRDSVVQGRVMVQHGGVFSMNYDDYSQKFLTGASINGQLVLEDGAVIENAKIYSNTNFIPNGNSARKNINPVVVVNGNVRLRGQVFIRGDEAPTGTDPETGKSFAGQTALQVNGSLMLEDGSVLAVYGGGKDATTSVGGDAIILDNGTISGNGKLIAVGGSGHFDNGGNAVSGTGTLSVKDSYLEGGASYIPKTGCSGGSALTQGVLLSGNTNRTLNNGESLKNGTATDSMTYWRDITGEPDLSLYDVPQNAPGENGAGGVTPPAPGGNTGSGSGSESGSGSGSGSGNTGDSSDASGSASTNSGNTGSSASESANRGQNGQTNPGNSGNANDHHTSGTSGSHRNDPSAAESSHGDNTDSDLAVNPHQVPKTGDTATLGFWMLMSGLAGTIFCMVLWAHRKRQLHVK